MTRGIRIRVIAFLVLSAVGVVYMSAAYLGFVDRLLGRGYSVTVHLPQSGGLFEGSEVTYRGVQVGEVSRMDATLEGVELELALQEEARIPLASPFYVHNLTAVGEQYLDFEPASDQGPFARDGDTFRAGPEALPVGEDELLVELDDFVSSVNEQDLRDVIEELGTAFRDTGTPLEKLLDHGTTFVDEAAAHEDETVQLLENGLVVLQTQKDQGENIRALARDLRLLTGSLRASDGHLRQVLQASPAALKEVDRLLVELEPTLPTLLGNLVSVNEVVVAHLPGVEQLLVTFPVVVSTGFTGTPADGWGRVSLQFDDSPGPCTQGYLPADEWRRGDQVDDTPIFPASCTAGPPYNMRGTRYAPAPTGGAYRGTYDPLTRQLTGAHDPSGRPLMIGEQGDLSILGGDAWKWLLIGPVRTSR